MSYGVADVRGRRIPPQCFHRSFAPFYYEKYSRGCLYPILRNVLKSNTNRITHLLTPMMGLLTILSPEWEVFFYSWTVISV